MAFCENHSGTLSITAYIIFFAFEKSDHLNNGLKNETDFVKQEIALTTQFLPEQTNDLKSMKLLKIVHNTWENSLTFTYN